MIIGPSEHEFYTSECVKDTMGKGRGHGSGTGAGVGRGMGEGTGEGMGGDKHDVAAVAGGCGAVCLIVCFCTVGLPALIAGCVLVALFTGVL